VKVLVVVEDDPDVQFLVETIFSMDSRFTLAGVAASAEEALESLRTAEPGIIVLDHALSGHLAGLDAAPRFKGLAPQAKNIMFTATPISRPAPTRNPQSTGSCFRPNQHSSYAWLSD